MYDVQPPLSAYEKIREGNIKRNNAKLSELNIAPFVKTPRKRKAKVAKQPVTTENNDNTEAFDAEKQTINKIVKIRPERKAKVAKLPVATDNNGSGSSSDDSDPQVPKWNYLALTDAQRGTLHSSVLAKVGESFIDR